MVHFLIPIGFFFLWACVWSFSWVLMETSVKRSFWTGRSQCISCHKQLRWYELIPLISSIVQKGRCRQCGVRIPAWVLGIEMMMGIVWMFFGTLLILSDMSLWIVSSHLMILSSLLMLAIEDMKSFTIPDRLSLPIIGMILVMIHLSEYLWERGIFPGWKYSILGGILWMVFYMIQMIIPAISALISKKNYHDIPSLLLSPLFFPFWIGVKLLFGEKKADIVIPSVEKLDHLPSWVGGGDVRLGILIGLIVGPLYFWWIIGIGYTIWMLFWAVSRVMRRTKMDILPVAPLLFLGFCAVFMIYFFS